MRPPGAAIVAGLLLLFAGCGGEEGFPSDSVASPELSAPCSSWMGAGVVALVCDPKQPGDGSGLSIERGSERAKGDPGLRLGIAQMVGEPLADGERVEFTLEGGSPRTVAALRAVGDARLENVVIEPFDPPARRYAVEIEGRVARVSTDTGEDRVIRIGEPEPDVELKDGSPEETIRSFVALVNHGAVGWRPACELLAERTREAVEQAEWGCESSLGMLLTYDEYGEYPEPTRSEVGAVSMREGDPGMAVVELTHRYRPDEPGQPSEKRVTALVPMSWDWGHWRILLPNWLSPVEALRGETMPSNAEIRDRLAKLSG